MSHSSTISVLHVDDERDLLELAGEFLSREVTNLELISETSPLSGLERLQNEEMDCIISDYQMPEMDGLEFLKEVRVNYPNLPFILFTGQGSEEIASEAITAGVTDYIQKGGPERYTLLANRVVNAVERARAIRQTDLSHHAMETATEGISLVQPDGIFSYVNSAFAELFGYDRSDLVGKHWTILYHNEEAERLENHILPAVVDKGHWSGETVRLTKDGERLITDHRLAYTEQGAIVCTAKDKTGERTGSVAQTTAFSLLIDTMDDYAFCTLDHEGYITRWSEEAKKLKGYDTEEILGRHISEFFPKNDRHRGIPNEQLEIARIDGSVTDEGWRLRKDRSKFWAEETISASYTDEGTLRGYGKLVKEAPNPSTA